MAGGERGERADYLVLDSVAVAPDEVGEMRNQGGDFQFKDQYGTFNPRTGSGGITADQHKTLRQLIHFISEGPSEGFASGAYREVTGTVFPTSIVWWESAAKLKKIVERTCTWTGVNLTTDKWEVYATDGITVLATVTDTISYSGVFETSRTRTIA